MSRPLRAVTRTFRSRHCEASGVAGSRHQTSMVGVRKQSVEIENMKSKSDDGAARIQDAQARAGREKLQKVLNTLNPAAGKVEKP
jgi:hypothetical protein